MPTSVIIVISINEFPNQSLFFYINFSILSYFYVTFFPVVKSTVYIFSLLKENKFSIDVVYKAIPI